MARTTKRPTKILIVLYYYHPYVSGLSIMAKRIAEGLVRAGHKVTVLSAQYDQSLPNREVINGVTVVRRPVLLHLGKGVIAPTFWLDIIRYSLTHDYVNVYLPLADSGLSSLFIPKRKLVTTYVCDINLGSRVVDRVIAWVAKALMHIQLLRSRVVLPLSLDYLSHSPMRRYAAKAVPAYPPITPSDFVPINPRPLFERLQLGDNTVKIGFVGRIVYEKGIDYLLQAIPYLEKTLKDFKIIIVGDYKKVAGGSTKEQLDTYLREYPERIVFTGFLNDLDRNRFYSGLDVFVLPSIDPLEAFGMVQVEAMLCGVPVVASDLPGVREIVGRTGFGQISKRKNPGDLAAKITEVVKRRSQYQPIRERVIACFDPQATIDTYSKLMSE